MAACEQMECSGSQGVLVGTTIDCRSHQLLWCGVVDCSERHVRGGKSADAFELTTDSEVGKEDSLPSIITGA
jgi:hypothetical protein